MVSRGIVSQIRARNRTASSSTRSRTTIVCANNGTHKNSRTAKPGEVNPDAAEATTHTASNTFMPVAAPVRTSSECCPRGSAGSGASCAATAVGSRNTAATATPTSNPATVPPMVQTSPITTPSAVARSSCGITRSGTIPAMNPANVVATGPRVRRRMRG